MSSLIESPYPQFFDKKGLPLEEGYIYIGEPGLSPLANPITPYWDTNRTIPAANIRTRGGYPWNGGGPGRLYTESNYSILVLDKNRSTVFTQLNAIDYTNTLSGAMNTVNTISELRGIVPAEAYVQASLCGESTAGDGEVGPLYYWDPASLEVDNDFSIIRPTALVSTDPGRWLWINTNAPLVTETISVSQEVDLAFKRKVFLIDTTSSDLEETLPDGDYNGQEVIFVNIGANVLTINGDGIPTDSIITSSIKLSWNYDAWYSPAWGDHDIAAASVTVSGDLTISGDTAMAGVTATDAAVDSLASTGDITAEGYYTGDHVTLHASAITYGSIYSGLSDVIPEVGDGITISGGYSDTVSSVTVTGIFSYAYRTSSTVIRLYGVADTTLKEIQFAEGSTQVLDYISITTGIKF